MRLRTIACVIDALYYSNFLASIPRGGLMLVAEPESMKSELLKVLKGHSGVLFQDDLNVRKINEHIRPAMARGKVTALVLPEFQKLFERRDDTSRNTLGHLRSFVHDGIYEGANDNPLEISNPATCLLFGGVTVQCFTKNISEWTSTGFGRRVIWVHYRLNEKEKDLIKLAHRLSTNLEIFTRVDFRVPVGDKIPASSTQKELAKIDDMFRNEVDPIAIPYEIEVKRMLFGIHHVLKWQKSKRMIDDDAMCVMTDFIPALGNRQSLEFPSELFKMLERKKRDRMAMEEQHERGNGKK